MVISNKPGAYDHLLEDHDIRMSYVIPEGEFFVADQKVTMLDGQPRKTMYFNPIDYFWVIGNIKRQSIFEIDTIVQDWIKVNIDTEASQANRRIDQLVKDMERRSMLRANERAIEREMTLGGKEITLKNLENVLSFMVRPARGR